jgi:uncharacterized membrane protein
MKRIQSYVVAGLLVWVPLGVTLLILRFAVNLMDETLILIPQPYRPETLLGFRIPGLGILLTVAVVLVTGVLVANIFGRRLLAVWEAILQRIPFVRSIYGGTKNFTEVVLGDSGQSFKKAVMVEWPRAGIYSIGFLTGSNLEELRHRIGEDIVSVFIPTTPNPTSGFVMFLPRRSVVELDMDVESALKLIVSLGIVVPKWAPHGDREARRAELAKAASRP